jgi:hypothetical protein
MLSGRAGRRYRRMSSFPDLMCSAWPEWRVQRRTYTSPVPLEGQWERQNTPLRLLGRRERRALVVIGTAFAVGLVVMVVALATHHTRHQRGCIDVPTPSTMGGALIHACGAVRDRLCSEEQALARPDRAILARCRAVDPTPFGSTRPDSG